MRSAVRAESHSTHRLFQYLLARLWPLSLASQTQCTRIDTHTPCCGFRPTRQFAIASALCLRRKTHSILLMRMTDDGQSPPKRLHARSQVVPIGFGWILCLACVLIGVATVGYSGQLEPLSVPQPVSKMVTLHLTETTVLQTFTVSATTTGTTRFASTYRTTKFLNVSRSGPSCPYGGQYRQSICTSLCGCQHDVCVTFDHNCANHYPAVYADRTVSQTLQVRTTVTNYLVRRNTLPCLLTTRSEFYRTTSTIETTVVEVPNPMQRTLWAAGFSLIASGALLFLILVLRRPREIPITRRKR